MYQSETEKCDTGIKTMLKELKNQAIRHGYDMNTPTEGEDPERPDDSHKEKHEKKYEVERITWEYMEDEDMKQRQYRISWKGRGKEHDTWHCQEEPEDADDSPKVQQAQLEVEPQGDKPTHAEAKNTDNQQIHHPKSGRKEGTQHWLAASNRPSRKAFTIWQTTWAKRKHKKRREQR